MNAPPESERDLILALFLLTFVTGIVDAASVLGLGHVFTANMTGNVIFLGFALAGRAIASVGVSLTALGSFLVGAVVGGRSWKDTPPSPIRVGLALEVAALGLGATVLGVAPGNATWTVVALLAFSMGLRNAVIRKLAVADMTTTVLTLTLTGLAADSSVAGRTNPRWRRRVGAAACMLLGAVFGARLLAFGIAWVVGAAAVLEAAGCWMLTRGVDSRASGPARRPVPT